MNLLQESRARREEDCAMDRVAFEMHHPIVSIIRQLRRGQSRIIPEKLEAIREKNPFLAMILKLASETPYSEDDEDRGVSSYKLSPWQWLQNRWRMFALKGICPPRCYDCCRGICSDPWAKAKPLPPGFCTCAHCCPCCGVAHRSRGEEHAFLDEIAINTSKFYELSVDGA